MDNSMGSGAYRADPVATLSGDEYFVQAHRVNMNLMWLNGEVGPGAGDVAGGQGLHPTDTSVAVLETIEKDLSAAKTPYRELMNKEVPAFNRSIAERGFTPLIANRKNGWSTQISRPGNDIPGSRGPRWQPATPRARPGLRCAG